MYDKMTYTCMSLCYQELSPLFTAIEHGIWLHTSHALHAVRHNYFEHFIDINISAK